MLVEQKTKATSIGGFTSYFSFLFAFSIVVPSSPVGILRKTVAGHQFYLQKAQYSKVHPCYHWHCVQPFPCSDVLVFQPWRDRNTLLARICSVGATKTKFKINKEENSSGASTPPAGWAVTPLLWGHLGHLICLSFSSSSWPRICSCPWRSSEGRAAYDAVSQSAPSRNILPVPPVISYATEWCGILN